VRPRLSRRALDVLLVVGIVAVDLSLLWVIHPDEVAIPGYDGPDAAGVLVIVAAALPLLWRRRAPVAVLVATTGIGLGSIFVPVLSQMLAPLAALYTLAVERPRRVSLAGLAAVGVAATAVTVSLDGTGSLPSNLAIMGIAWLLGDVQRTREANTAALTERTRALLADRERAAQLAVVTERTRIARELHDVVAHSIGVMIVQAGAARRTLDTDLAAAREATGHVAATGRQTLAELRQLLGLLREEEAQPDYAPQPGLADLPELIATYDGGPLRIALSVEGEPRPVPSGVDLSAYRIVQESLTNALRHAGPAAVEVRLAWHDDRLDIEVADDGRGPLVVAGPPLAPGHGLVGMRERAALVGGTITAGARGGGGFRVRAELPLETL
jgi:signal transduction histidine kinase